MIDVTFPFRTNTSSADSTPFQPMIHLRRILSLFALSIGLMSSAWSAEAPLTVFVLAGQSNMQGHANIRTFDYLGKDPRTAPLLSDMRNADGTPKACQRTWISFLSPDRTDAAKTGKLTTGFGANSECIGPEFTFGLTMEKHLSGPVLLIKTAWGGKSLHTDFRSPGSGPATLNESQIEGLRKQGKDIESEKSARAAASGIYYRKMIDHVKEVLSNPSKVVPDLAPDQKVVLGGFVWFQGWNDMVDSGVYPHRDKPDGYASYSSLLAQFIRDVRKDLGAPKLPFVIGVMGVGGPVSDYAPDEQRYSAIHQNFRNAMAAPALLPEFSGSVVNVLTEKSWDSLQSTAVKKRDAVGSKMNALRKSGQTMSRDEEQSLHKKMLSESCSKEELDALDGISNFAFHYLGSAKILGQIGKSFADAMHPLVQKP